jgi:nuclear pore complex protein Nup93
MLVGKWYDPFLACSRMNLTRYPQTLATLRKKSRSLMVFAGMLRYRLSPDVYSYLARLDVEVAL